MAENNDPLDRLEKRLENLVRTQVDFQKEIIRIRQEIAALRGPSQQAPPQNITPPAQQRPPEQPQWPEHSQPPPQQQQSPPAQPSPSAQQQQAPPPPREAQAPNFGYTTGRSTEERAPRFKDKSELEKFIGENLISKIGILVLIIGVGIGAKYAIDQGWITPLMRVAFSYAIGFGLIALAVKLKAKYLNFSAVLLSGAMAIMYFITYFAYAIYKLMPQSAAFVLMVMFTIFTVASALMYNRQVIAHIGLVGAYAVPFLLSNNSGNYAFLFTYMALVNAGILAISVKRNWKPLTYTSFLFTWLTYGGWYAAKYDEAYFNLALIFLGIFFATFHLVTVLQHKFFKVEDEKEQFPAGLVLTILNSAVFYGICFAFVDKDLPYFQTSVLFAFIAAITLGVVIVSLRDYRRPVHYASFLGTWACYFFWFQTFYSSESNLLLGSTFLVIYFSIFYITALIHSKMFPDMAAVENVTPILTNAFIFFGIGYAMLDARPEYAASMGLFTLAHAFLHFIVAAGAGRVKNFPVEITYLLTGLVITFITIAIPIQFDGTAVTIAWSAQAAVLFGIGRLKQVRVYEWLSYPLLILAICGLLAEWLAIFANRPVETRFPLTHSTFISALVYVAAMAVIVFVNRKPDYEPPGGQEDIRKLVGYSVGTLALLALYNTFRTEIPIYFDQVILRRQQGIDEGWPGPVWILSTLWQINYTLFFLTILGAVNMARLRSSAIAIVNCIIGTIATMVFCLFGLIILGGLRGEYLANGPVTSYIFLRYISLLFAAGLFVVLHRYTRREFVQKLIDPFALSIMFDALFYPILLVILSSELINWMDIAGYTDSYKLGLSILWGAYALFLVAIGIYFKKRHLRIGAIVLFAITLAKLFLYDISQLSTIAKTAVFVSVGILMLIVSFLYTKYKNVIFGSDAGEEIPA